jgi:hypothetical protein
METYTVKQFAAAIGKPARTVQHWLAIGALPAVEKTARGYEIPQSYCEFYQQGILPFRDKGGRRDREKTRGFLSSF